MKEFLLKYLDQYIHLLPGIGRSLLAAALILLGGRVLKKMAERMIKRAVDSSKIRIDETLGTVLRLVINYAVIFVCAIMILENFGFNTTSLIALLGAAGVAIGLALKDTLSNIASGIILLILRPFKKDDFIEFGAISGNVRELGLFVTVIETGDGVFISVPNSNLWGPPLRNYSRSKKRRMDLSVNISNSEDLEKAVAMMEGISREEKRFLQTPAPQVVTQPVPDMGGGGNPGVTVILRAWAPADQFGKINQELLRIIRDRTVGENLRPPVPQREITVVNKQPVPFENPVSDKPEAV